MKNLHFLISLITNENDYQLEQAKAADDAARKLGATAQIIYAGNDSINQSQQLLSIIQSSGAHPDAIIVEPVGGTGLPHVARAAVGAGMGWVVLNREADYISELRRNTQAPVFCVSANHLEAGRIQGQHLAAFVPKDGNAFYIQGPSTTAASRQRTLGMEQTKPAGIKLTCFRGNWTEESAYKAICSWMKLSTSKKAQIDMIVAQNDDMAMGARKAFQEQPDLEVRDRWLNLPFSGCDGLPKTGQAFVRSGLLAATIVIPPNTSVAMELFAESTRTAKQPSDLVLTTPVSFPSLEQLSASAAAKGNIPAIS
jgi:ABC-type sugar transport system substrate-binding protein